MQRFTRRSAIRRAAGTAVGLMTFAALEPPVADAASYCAHLYPYVICASGTTSTCRVQYGPPSCTYSEVTVYSPNDRYYQRCYVTCPQCNCTPAFWQARGATQNSGGCSCTLVQ